jgi:hypothetical protein
MVYIPFVSPLGLQAAVESLVFKQPAPEPALIAAEDFINPRNGGGSPLDHHSGGLSRVGRLPAGGKSCSYRAGPLPKPFKIIPSLPACARILALTAPEKWSSQAAYAATRFFILNMKPRQARVYLEGVVLGFVRADLEQPSTRKDMRKLSPHLYEALKRALYKPAAFFKGIVFPLSYEYD